MRDDESVAVATGLVAVAVICFILLGLAFFDLSWNGIALAMALLTLVALTLTGLAKEFFWR